MIYTYLILRSDSYPEMKDLVTEANRYGSNKITSRGYITHAQTAPVLCLNNGVVKPIPMTWGITKRKQKDLQVCARGETVMQKESFRELINHHRCIIPSTGYIAHTFPDENGRCERVQVLHPTDSILYMSGIFNPDTEQFCMLSVAANDSVRDFNDRMPVIINNEEIKDWIEDNGKTEFFIKRVQPEVRTLMV